MTQHFSRFCLAALIILVAVKTNADSSGTKDFELLYQKGDFSRIAELTDIQAVTLGDLPENSKHRVLFLKCLSLLQLQKLDSAKSCLLKLDDTALTRWDLLDKYELLGIIYLKEKDNVNAEKWFHALLILFDTSQINQLRKSMTYYAVLARLAWENMDYSGSETLLGDMKGLSDRCDAVGQSNFCDLVYNGTVGRFYNFIGKSVLSKEHLQKAIVVYESSIADYANSQNYLELKNLYLEPTEKDKEEKEKVNESVFGR